MFKSFLSASIIANLCATLSYSTIFQSKLIYGDSRIHNYMIVGSSSF